jgi:hypothetical protein
MNGDLEITAAAPTQIKSSGFNPKDVLSGVFTSGSERDARQFEGVSSSSRRLMTLPNTESEGSNVAVQAAI